MKRAVLSALLACLIAPYAQAGSTVTLQITVVKDEAQTVLLDDNGESLEFPVDGNIVMITRDAPPVALDAGLLSVQWKTGTSSVPTRLISAFAAHPITVNFEREVFTDVDSDKADALCWHTPTSGRKVAFRKLFSCSDWVRLLEARNERFTPTHLKGLRGWFEANVFLSRLRVAQSLQIGPFGLQPELITALKTVVETYDGLPEGQRSDFDTFLRIEDIRAELAADRQSDLKWFGLVSTLIASGDYESARIISQHVLEVFDAISEETGDTVIDRLTRPLIEQAVALSVGPPGGT